MAASDAETVRIEPVGEPAGPRRRTSAGGRALIVVLMILVVLAGILVLVETVGRSIAERNVATSIEQGLPEGVEGDVDVRIHGVSALWQVMTGSMDEIVATAPALDVYGVPVDVVEVDPPRFALRELNNPEDLEPIEQALAEAGLE